MNHKELGKKLFVPVGLEEAVVKDEEAAQADVARALVRLVGLACHAAVRGQRKGRLKNVQKPFW